MKKLLITSAMMLTSLFSTAGTVGVDVDHVRNAAGQVSGMAHILRWNDTVDGINYGLSNRTVTYGSNPSSPVPSAKLRSADGWGMWNNFEGSVGKTFDIGLPFKVSPFVAAGYDDGRNGAVNASFWYTRVGVGTGFPVGPGRLNLGVNTRLNFESSDPKQSVVSAVYSVPVTQKLSVSLRVINSYQTIKEDYRGIGLTYKF